MGEKEVKYKVRHSFQKAHFTLIVTVIVLYSDALNEY